MYNDNFLFNYMFLRSNKKFVSSSKAASLALQSTAFTTSPVGGFMTANNMLKAEKASKQKKDAIKLKDEVSDNLKVLEETLSAAEKGGTATFIKDKLGSSNYKLVLAKAANISIEEAFADKGAEEIAGIKDKLDKAGGIEKVSYADIKDKLKF